jgi:ParB/RepB/Spo0J family partition protein
MPEKRVKLIYGYNRLRAALEIRQRRADFRLEIKVYDGINDQDAFIMNLRENMIRSEVSPIDNAHNIRKLVNHYGFETKDVAELYKRSSLWVSDTLKLLTLPCDVQEAVADGVLSREVGLKLSQLPEPEASAVLADAVRQVDAEEADDQGPDEDEGATAPADMLPLAPATTVDDDALAAAIASLPARAKTAEPAEATGKGKGKGKTKGRKPASELTPAEAQSRKTARQAKVSAAARKKVAERGVRCSRSLPELRAILKHRQDEIAIALLGFFDGSTSEDDLIDALDNCQSPIVSTKGQKPLKVAATGA